MQAILNRLVAEDHRAALERQAEEHHRPEQASTRGSASSGPRGSPVTAQDRDYTQAEPRGTSSCVVTQHAAPDRFWSGEAARWTECIKVAPPRQRNHTEMEQAYEDFKLRFDNFVDQLSQDQRSATKNASESMRT